jgi:hypothetical protein
MSQSQAAARMPQYSAVVVCGRYTEIRLTQLIAVLRSIAPSSAIGDWAGPFRTPPTDALGTGMISINGVSLTLLNVDKPLPPFFDTGPIPNQLMPNPLQQLRDHRAHVSVMLAQLPQDGLTALVTARAVMLLAWAVAIVTRAEAVKWTDANNFFPAAVLQGCAAMLSPVSGTYLLHHAYSVCLHMFRSDYDVKYNDTIDADGENVFKIEAIQQGFFEKAPTLRLSWLAASKSFNPNQPTR